MQDRDADGSGEGQPRLVARERAITEVSRTDDPAGVASLSHVRLCQASDLKRDRNVVRFVPTADMDATHTQSGGREKSAGT